ncbi:uncharacterized protein LOC123226740 [Mangifera indica]|uniref:uncharacterized protein LOC123226740 n=1 Tax=Mangifera indica TaxID=29780 RepID=UPI001CF9C92B|nr:uncharacterized protein LOC123226740 [Mangifera indica]
MENLCNRLLPWEKTTILGCQENSREIWASYGLTEVMTSGQGVFILKFQDFDGVSRAVEEGQLTIAGQLFLVRKWTTNLPMLINDVKKVATWVRMYGIPLEFWTPKSLSYIASAIGTPLYADSITEEGTRLDYARICIEIKVDAECPDSICLTLSNGECMVINVEYSWKPLKCNVCQCFGHSTSYCSFASKLEGSSSSWKILKDRAGTVVAKKQNGKDNIMQEAKGYDKKAKGKGVEIQKSVVITHKSNRFSVLAIKESHEQDKTRIVMHEKGNLERTTDEVYMEGKKTVNIASTSKTCQFTGASGNVLECDETPISVVEDMDNEASPTIVPFGGKLKVDEMDLRKKDVDLKSMNLGKKLAKLKKANCPLPLSK